MNLVIDDTSDSRDIDENFRIESCVEPLLNRKGSHIPVASLTSLIKSVSKSLRHYGCERVDDIAL